MKCLECGHDLEVMRQELLEFTEDTSKKELWPIWKSSHTEYAGHCENCLSDWSWDEFFNEGMYIQTVPARIFWG